MADCLQGPLLLPHLRSPEVSVEPDTRPSFSICCGPSQSSFLTYSCSSVPATDTRGPRGPHLPGTQVDDFYFPFCPTLYSLQSYPSSGSRPLAGVQFPPDLHSLGIPPRFGVDPAFLLPVDLLRVPF